MHQAPRWMRAVAIDRFGGPEVLKVRKLPVPEITSREVLIQLDTAGVGPWDAEWREGYPPEKKFPLIPGTDGAGIVAAAGSQARRRFKVGDRVYAYSYGNEKGGFYAEYVAVAASKVGHVPKNLALMAAGAIGTTGLTALQGVDALQIEMGESIIVHAASGGVGCLALQFTKQRGARVLATASGEDGVALVHHLGADVAVDGKEDDIRQSAEKFSPGGVDAVLAFAGGPPLTECLDALRKGGRVVYPNGVEPAPRKRKGIRIKSYDGEPGVRQFERLNRAIVESKLKVPIAASYSLKQARKAHERLAKGHVLGKIVLKIR
jgi:NADPH2:quinone reductase